MPSKKSAGIVLFRRKNESTEFFLVHPGGPFWTKKDAGAWSIPKGEYEEGEVPLDAAVREFKEETGFNLDAGHTTALTPITQKNGKIVCAWAIEGDADPNKIASNTFEIEWPPKSGKIQTFPEVDRAGWFSYNEAREKINPAQGALLDELMHKLGSGTAISAL